MLKVNLEQYDFSFIILKNFLIDKKVCLYTCYRAYNAINGVLVYNKKGKVKTKFKPVVHMINISSLFYAKVQIFV